MNSSVNKLFVYGSLRSGFGQPAYAYLSRYFHLLGNGMVKGNLYDMGAYAAAKPTDEPKFIHGELYEINQMDELGWAIGQLDEYEGVCVEPGERPLYIREAVNVLLDSQEHKAWIYWFNGDTAGYPEILSGDMLQYMQQKNNP
jgi:gamma-glutamylcyclotransferase (GGCT)/AIG2-like uncharacterized protein YtfP